MQPQMATETGSNKAPDWGRLLTEYELGASDVEIAVILGITLNRFMQLEQENPAFAEFVERGRTLSRAYWYKVGRTALFDKNMNTSLYVFTMKNRFGWADKVETNDTSDKESVDQDKLRAQLQLALKRLGKKNPELLSGANLHLTKNANV